MRNQLLTISSIFILLLLFTNDQLYGQIEEPDIRDIHEPRTPFDDGVRSGLGFNVVINNFGFGIGGQYRRVLSDYTYGTATLRMTGLRDVSEQTFTDIFFGQQVIPNKFQRAFAFPLMIGIRQRFFARQIADNFRFYLNGGFGPVAAFSYPYFEDRNNNGFREQFQTNFEPVNDIFTGISDGEWHLGLAGEFKISLDIGDNFARLTSLEFGYMFYFFDDGIQIMQPNQPILDPDAGPGDFPFRHTNPNDPANSLELRPFFDPQRFFGTPQISLTFGRMW